MYSGEFVSIIGGRGYRPGIIKEVGKRTVLVEWADDTTERIKIDRVIETKNLRETAFVERMFYLEEEIINELKIKSKVK